MSTHNPSSRVAASPGRSFVAPTGEMKWWASTLRRAVYADHAPARALRFALVTPLAHVANLSFDFQAYLYAIFHRRWLSRWTHRILFPVITAATMATLMRAHEGLGIALSGGMVAWYVVQARYNRMPALAVVMAGLGTATALAGYIWHRATVGASAWLHPGVGVLTLSFLVALSHAGEPDVPPRTSGEDRWVPMGAFFRRRPLAALGRSAVSIASGTLNEVWGAWRLYPVMVAGVLWRLGIDREHHTRLQDHIRRAIETGDPAVDHVGTGNGDDALDPYARRATPAPDDDETAPGQAPEKADLGALVARIRSDLDRGDWRHERTRTGVSVYSHRGLDAPVVGYRTVVEVDARAAEIAAYLGPGLLDAFAEMNHLYVDGHVLLERDGRRVVRTRFSMPGPMAGREFVHLLHVAQVASNEYVVAYLGVEGDPLPAVSDGYVRCPVYASGQRITERADGTTRVEHLMVYELSGGVPRWAQNHLFHRGHVDAYLREWRGLVERFGAAAGDEGAAPS